MVPSVSNVIVFRRTYGFDIDEFGIARAQLPQFLTYRSGIAFVVEEILPLVICRPAAVAAVIPGGDPCIDSRSKRNAVHAYLMRPNMLNYRKCDLSVPNSPDPSVQSAQANQTPCGHSRPTKSRSIKWASNTLGESLYYDMGRQRTVRTFRKPSVRLNSPWAGSTVRPVTSPRRGERELVQITRLSARTQSSLRDSPSSSQKISVLCSPINGARLEIRQGEAL